MRWACRVVVMLLPVAAMVAVLGWGWGLALAGTAALALATAGGHMAEALEHSGRAVAEAQDLVRQDRRAFLPQLATVVNHHAMLLGQSGDLAGAIEQALDQARRLRPGG